MTVGSILKAASMSDAMNAEGGKGFLFWEQMLASGSRIISKLLRLTRLRAEWPDTIAGSTTNS
ncbi:hypothetical protein N183_38275 [Sinorhizobium sp. Sb3]|nr:hypothetical protein N183_38275 [Sinorhizobium sp. Sb3]